MNGHIELPRDLLKHIQGQGFIALKLPADAQFTIDSTLAAAQFFFRSSPEDKAKGRLPDDLGYRAFQEEYSQSAERRDQLESFSANLKGVHFAANLMSGLPLILYTRMLAVINVLERIAEAATSEIAKELLGHDLPSPLEGAFRWWSFLQLNYSFPSQVTADYINDLHEDGCLITIAFASTPGLEVQLPSGDITTVTTAANEVLVIPGEIMWLLSGGAVRPLFHRVRPVRSYSERAALLYFGDIAPERCLPWIANELNKDIDIGDRVLKNPTRYGLQEWTR